MQQLISRRNPLLAHMKKLGVSKRYREETGRFICDGMKLLEEAIDHDAEICTVLAAAPIPFPLPMHIRVYYATKDIVEFVSPLKNAQPILFECSLPEDAGKGIDPATDIAAGGTGILLDGLQDPGNVGSIIRTANAFGIDNVILHGECADLYNPKTIRATMGAVFRQKVRHMDFAVATAMKKSGIRFIGATPRADAKDVSEVDFRGAVVAIGSEGGGLSDGMRSICDYMIKIPMSSGCESLGAAIAAAIIMYNAKRGVSVQ
jgi:TrmH family RNA methyltransferase